ncbi:MAG: hypothetical protein M5U30_07460 [Burkholderiaceae bacterium]|nr:hypothetical protein [Burkholderiaceae bacterium]
MEAALRTLVPEFLFALDAPVVDALAQATLRVDLVPVGGGLDRIGPPAPSRSAAIESNCERVSETVDWSVSCSSRAAPLTSPCSLRSSSSSIWRLMSDFTSAT